MCVFFFNFICRLWFSESWGRNKQQLNITSFKIKLHTNQPKWDRLSEWNTPWMVYNWRERSQKEKKRNEWRKKLWVKRKDEKKKNNHELWVVSDKWVFFSSLIRSMGIFRYYCIAFHMVQYMYNRQLWRTHSHTNGVGEMRSLELRMKKSKSKA